jgi:hypothetical protein
MANDLRTKLADTLAKATKAARSQVVKTSWLVRADREFLTERGYLQEIVKGWYILGRPVDSMSSARKTGGEFAAKCETGSSQPQTRP